LYCKVKSVNRRSFLTVSASALAASAASVAAYAKWVEPINLQVHQHSCKLPALVTDRAIRLLHLSDLHASPDVPNSLIESAIGLALELKPDLVCITGDFVTDRWGWNSAWYRRTLRRLTDRLPVYGTMGNHDGGWRPSRMQSSEIVRDLLRDAGLQLLHNRTVTVMAGAGQPGFELTGLGDLWGGEFRPDAAFSGPRTRPRIVLSHNPDTKDRLTHQQWDLMLSGHTHGGQIVIPVVGSPWAPVKDMRYLHGLKAWGPRQIHVTSGVGNARGVRFNCPPELVVLELTGHTAT
jgi:uncharacterized protein